MNPARGFVPLFELGMHAPQLLITMGGRSTIGATDGVGVAMATFVIIRLNADPVKLEGLFTERAADFTAIADVGRASGAKHHQFLKGDGEVVIVDEWDSAQQFQSFFHGETGVAELMAAAGVEGPPEISVYEILDSPDRF
jgi:heme-degrading monooxygenase HmoA